MLKKIINICVIFFFSATNSYTQYGHTKIEGLRIDHYAFSQAISYSSDEIEAVNELHFSNVGVKGIIFQWKIWRWITTPPVEVSFTAVAGGFPYSRIKCQLEIKETIQIILLTDCGNDQIILNDILIAFEELRVH